tara:strand:+ start:956 stop:1357 length:402 start_codon:yes stop_codon:yes gene_type:complete
MVNMDKKILLSTLWLFVTVNYIFCDVFTLFYAPDLNQFLTGQVGGIELTQGFLLTFAIIMEFAMVMIVLSRVLKYSSNRWLNLIGGIVFTLIQAGTLLDGNFTMHYLFFSLVEISATLYIFWAAWNWRILEKA